MGEEISSDALLKLPTIDFSNRDLLKPGSPEWDLIKVQVHKALEEFGCFEALVDEFPLELRQEVLEAMKDGFDLPLETKMLNVSEKPYHGYLGVHPERSPLYESFGIDGPNIIENVEGLSNTLWPQGNKTFSKSIYLLSEQTLGLERMVRRMVLESFGLEKYMEEHMDYYYLLRLTKYNGPETNEAKLGLYGHTDKNIVSILYQNNDVDALEVRTKNGEWIHVKPSSPRSLIVMIGDSFYAWLNGRLHCPFHRVMMKGNKTRYSTALFSVPKAGCTVKAPQELVDEQHPLLFKPFIYGQFLQYLSTEAGQTADCALKVFCGA